jgi:hypothetical protein
MSPLDRALLAVPHLIWSIGLDARRYGFESTAADRPDFQIGAVEQALPRFVEHDITLCLSHLG